MLLPRYTIRTVLYLAVLVAVVAVIAGQAVQGATWALAVTIAVCSLAVAWAVFVLFYGTVAAFARVALGRELQAPRPAYYPAPHSTTDTTPNEPAALNSSTASGD